jgi:DNA-binding NtrC family response regulator
MIMTSASQQPVKILFVDDEKGILLSLSHLLRNENFEVITAASGEEGLEIISNTEGIGVIISDQIMPSMNGVEFLSKAWKLAPDSIRIMLTGHSGPDVEHEALYKGGAYRFISKPWKNDELIQTLRDAVTIYNLIRENRRLTSLLHCMTSDKTDQHRENTFSTAA